MVLKRIPSLPLPNLNMAPSTFNFLGLQRRWRCWPLTMAPLRRYSGGDLGIGEGGDEFLPVLIVGAGPVGLVLSILLTKLGIKCVVVERSKHFSQHPQAHFINNRTMEIFRKLDGLAEDILQLQPPVDLWRKFIYCTSLSGPIIGSVDHMKPQDFEQMASPISVAHFSQYKLNQLLLKKLKGLDFHVCECDDSKSINLDYTVGRRIFMCHECVSVRPNPNGVNVGIAFFKEGKRVVKNILCSFLVGSDGAGSTVRKLAGIGMEGERDLQKLVSVHFRSKHLGQYLLRDRPGMLFFVFNPDVIGVLVAHDLQQGEFVLQMPFYPPQQRIEDFSFEVCKDFILKLIGQDLEDINVIDVKPWIMHAEVAEHFVSCGNRVMLVGDAAHRFPPAGGFGMNTGIQDAHNLAWKIASLLEGKASSSIIQTYETERKPIAVFNTALSVQNFKAAMSVPAALGLDPSVANTVHKMINMGVGAILPLKLQKAVLEGIFTIGRAQLREPILNEYNPLGSSRLSRLRAIFDEGKSLQLQFPAEDLGFRYMEGALVPETANESHHYAADVTTGRRKDYVPTSDPGSRLPHMKIMVLDNVMNRNVFSTLDLVSLDRLEFILIIAPKKESFSLAEACAKIAKEFNTSLKTCILWPNESFTENMEKSKLSTISMHNVINVMAARSLSASPSWWDLCQITDRGAILVRPDEHIAWRAKSEVTGDLISLMRGVFSKIFGNKLSE